MSTRTKKTVAISLLPEEVVALDRVRKRDNPRRPAGGDRRAAEGGREALPRARPRHLRHPARRPARRPRPLREGGDPGLPRYQDRRRNAVDPRDQPPKQTAQEWMKFARGPIEA